MGDDNFPGFSLSQDWYAALGISADPSYNQPRTPDTVTSNAVQTMQPITPDNGGGWTDFWKGALQTAIGYGIQKDAVQSGVRPGYQQPAYPNAPQNQAAYQAAQQRQGGNLLLLAGGGLLVYLLATR